MLVQRIIQSPAPGKAPDLQALARENADAMNKAGSPHSLSTRMFAQEAALVTSIRFENLAAIETYQDRNQGSAEYQTRIRKIGEVVGRASQELWDVLVPAQATANPRFVILNRHVAAPGKAQELRRLLEERVRLLRTIPGVIDAGLSAQISPPDGPAFVTATGLASLAGADQMRAAIPNNAAFQANLAQAAALYARPAQQEHLRILVPFPG